MLSKKMAVSLTSLITIFALAFIAPTAFAADFGVSLDMTNDASELPGFQLAHPGKDKEVTLNVEFDKAVILKKANVQVFNFDKDGIFVEVTTLAEDGTAAKRAWEIKVKVKENTALLVLQIAKGIASADLLDTDTSKALEKQIRLISAADAGDPRVYSIRRADNATSAITAKSVEVIITLSEKPIAFGKDHISVTNATHSAPVALPALPEDKVGLKLLSNANIIDVKDPMQDTSGLNTAINKALATDPAATDADPDTDGDQSGESVILNVYKDALTGLDGQDALIFALHEKLDAALPNTAPDANNYHYLDKDGKLVGKIVNARTDADVTTLLYEGAIVAPTTQGTQDITVDAVAETNAELVLKAKDFDRSKAVDKYVPPALGEAGYAEKFALYEALIVTNNASTAGTPAAQRAAYTAEKKIYDAYIALEDKLKEVALELVEAYRDKLVEQVADRNPQTIVHNQTGTHLWSTGRDGMLYPYSVTITPKYTKKGEMVRVRVKRFADTETDANWYMPPTKDSDYIAGFDQLTMITGAAAAAVATTPGQDVMISKGVVIPKDGYLVVAKSIAGSAVRNPGTATKAPANPPRQAFGLTYNLVAGALPNLESMLISGGTIDIVGPKKLVISEIMWGTDASLASPDASQYIELRNVSGAAITAGDKDYKLVFYFAGSTPPAMTAASNIQDRVSTVGWSITGKGQGGRTGVDEAPGDAIAVAPTQALISMQRVIDAAGTAADGTMKDNWAGAVDRGFNFDPNKQGIRYGSPGRAPSMYPTAPTPPKPTLPATVAAAGATDIKITEIMVDSDNGRLPQWIELTSSAASEVSLEGWQMVIDNAIDADVLGGGNAITVSLNGVTIDVSAHAGNTGDGQSVLVVAWTGRYSPNIKTARVINLRTQLNQTRRYQLLSEKGFRITLVPPDQGAIADFGDIAGNLDEDWELEMDETGRSSLIRREVLADGSKPMGTDANGWILASSTSLVSGPTTWYGSDEDAGTPGYDAGGPLPVELSHFRPARDKATGAVVITWATQSELNNAGFFIKRSNQKDGEFKVINATMIAGAGTTSEKQFYTYTDTTAQPNVVYYYQIEDVSLDGNRQILTRGTRLKGHIGAAGKATVTWGELKTSNE